MHSAFGVEHGDVSKALKPAHAKSLLKLSRRKASAGNLKPAFARAKLSSAANADKGMAFGRVARKDRAAASSYADASGKIGRKNKVLP